MGDFDGMCKQDIFKLSMFFFSRTVSNVRDIRRFWVRHGEHEVPERQELWDAQRNGAEMASNYRGQSYTA